jgi:uncharacterized protein YbjT (DUF2867 family)
MHVILGASGNTGRVVTQNLLNRGQKVRAVGRNADHLQPLAAKGAEIFVADVTDSAALAKAFSGADSAYVMLPPNVSTPDPRGYQERASDAIATAVNRSRLSHIVSLSSVGTDKTSGTGPVVGLRNLEQKLNQTSAPNILHIRAGYFMENTLPQAGVIRMTGSSMGPLRPDLKVPMIAARDIGAFAAEALGQRNFQGKTTQELLGHRDLDYNEVAAVLGKAVGKPDLRYVQAPNDQLRAAMTQMGMSPNFVDLLLEMAGSLNSGHMRALEPRSPRNTTPTSYEAFVQDTFLPLYRQQAAA